MRGATPQAGSEGHARTRSEGAGLRGRERVPGPGSPQGAGRAGGRNGASRSWAEADRTTTRSGRAGLSRREAGTVGRVLAVRPDTESAEVLLSSHRPQAEAAHAAVVVVGEGRLVKFFQSRGYTESANQTVGEPRRRNQGPGLLPREAAVGSY